MDNTTNLTNIDLSAFDNLSPEERSLAISLLQEYAENGKSEGLNNLLLEDYAEVPVSIEEFVDNYEYLGNAWHDAQGNSKLYPYWRKELNKLFPDNITTSVNNAIFSGSRGRGKMNPLTTPVLTSEGFRPMGSLKIGDEVYGEDGVLHKILQVFPQGKLDVYKVTFTDGTSCECGLEHLWEVTDHHIMRRHKACPPERKVVDTAFLLRHKNNLKRFNIPMCEPIHFPKREVPLDPYLLGCLIGDGHLSSSRYISISTKDTEIREAFERDAISRSYHLYNGSNDCDFRLMSNQKLTNHLDNTYIKIIADLGLIDKKSVDKFIPELYLYNSVDTRIAILQGLLDTDGEANKSRSRNSNETHHSIVFSTISPHLKDNIIELVQSLGGTATYKRKESKYRNKGSSEYIQCQDHYRICIRLPEGIEPFRLTRKSILYHKGKHTAPARYFKSIEKLPEQQECQCIYIDSPRHLYLVNDYIVTHNTEIAVLIAAYLLHRILCLKNPIEYYHLKATEKIVFAFTNIKLALAEEIATTKFQNTIKSSPWFLNHGSIEGRTKKVWIPQKYPNINGELQEAVDIKIGSQADDLIGLPIFYCFADEISFIKNKNIDEQKAKAYDLLDTAIGGMKTRFVYKGKNPTMLCLASSKRSDKSFLEEHMKKKLESEKENVYISDGSVWEVKPEGTYQKETFKVALGNKFKQSVIIPEGEDESEYLKNGYSKILDVPLDFKPNFIDDIDRALCDFAGISSSSITKYINGAAIRDLITNKTQNPFSKEILEISNDPEDDVQYYNFFDIQKVDPRLRNKPLFIHMDMSISGDMTGIAGVFISGKKIATDNLDQSKDLYYSLAFSVNIKAPKGRQISFEKNRNFIYWLKKQGFNIKGITTDTFQSYDTGETLRSKGYPYSVLSVDRVGTNKICEPYQYLRSTIYEKRLEMYDDKTLVEELVDLERNMDSGKIDHPDGGRKDIADAVCGAIYNASKYAEQFAFDYGESAELTLKLNADPQDFAQEINKAFEEEMKNMHPIPKPTHPSNIIEKRTDYNLYPDIIIL